MKKFTAFSQDGNKETSEVSLSFTGSCGIQIEARDSIIYLNSINFYQAMPTSKFFCPTFGQINPSNGHMTMEIGSMIIHLKSYYTHGYTLTINSYTRAKRTKGNSTSHIIIAENPNTFISFSEMVQRAFYCVNQAASLYSIDCDGRFVDNVINKNPDLDLIKEIV